MKVETNIDEFEKELSDFESDINEDMLWRIALRVERNVVETITEVGLVDTGRFRGSIRGRVLGMNSILISDGVTYGKFHETGTIHITEPKQPFKKALRQLQEDIGISVGENSYIDE